DNEFSLELTWRRQLTKSIAIQPSFQYINNGNGNFTVLSTRLCCSF
ncbi:MAG: carbohydrate porin, partial [Prevotella pectinovora]